MFESYFRNYCSGVQLEPEKPRIIRDELGRYIARILKLTTLKMYVILNVCISSSKGFGFVNFNNSWSADRVVSKRYHTIYGKRVVCKLASSKKGNQNPIISRNVRSFNVTLPMTCISLILHCSIKVCVRRTREPMHLRQVFVNNLNVSTTEQQLTDYFETITSDVKGVFIKFDENNK